MFSGTDTRQKCPCKKPFSSVKINTHSVHWSSAGLTETLWVLRKSCEGIMRFGQYAFWGGFIFWNNTYNIQSINDIWHYIILYSLYYPRLILYCLSHWVIYYVCHMQTALKNCTNCTKKMSIQDIFFQSPTHPHPLPTTESLMCWIFGVGTLYSIIMTAWWAVIISLFYPGSHFPGRVQQS